ncbi:outer membrane beta-barrel protein [uncultured Croceitalea sp.]|uniref:outer membrane beta-barrel protein n=1 Tax=uncultured Croceitalea sp. TaxID=1798908 RepID=UPI00330616EE
MGNNLSKQIKVPLVALLLLSASLCAQSQQHTSTDSFNTPFRKGRWLTGLSGSISSNTSEVSGLNEKTVTNEFGLNISTGRFIKDRWLFGGNLNADRASSGGTVDSTRETLFIGPFLSYYLSPNHRGSLFTRVSPGYVRYSEETQLNTVALPTEFSSEGGGFGTLIGLGYSYVIHDKIAFDIGFDLNLFWINIDQEQQPLGTVTTQKISISNTAFTFGFNVILDDFFF